jgi:hypothetical protein
MINHGRHVFVSDSCSIFLVQCVMDIFYEVDVDQLVTPLLLSLGNGSLKLPLCTVLKAVCHLIWNLKAHPLVLLVSITRNFLLKERLIMTLSWPLEVGSLLAWLVFGRRMAYMLVTTVTSR